jgi:ActR/RegA family two-component response regulator
VGSRENVLIVEDESEWRGIYQRAMGARGPGQTVKVAKDLAGAERLIEAAKFAVAFVDVGLDASDDRNVDGLRVMEKIRAAGDETSIVVVTGRGGQDVLAIARDAIKKYDAYDTVGKSTVKPAELRSLLEGGLEAYRDALAEAGKKAIADGRSGVRDALRGQTDANVWEYQVMQVTQFEQDAGKFHGFLNELLGDYLPVVARRPGGAANVDSSAGLVYGDYWSRAIASAVVACFGAADRFDEAVAAARAGTGLLGKYEIADPLKEVRRRKKGSESPGVKGAVFPLAGCQREDFGRAGAVS